MPEPCDINDASPPTLDHVIGNERAVRQIRTALDAYFNDRASGRCNGQTPAFPHTLLVGPPGVGKSLFASLIASELGTTLHQELAQNLPTPMHLHGLMMLPENEDVVFVDEVHELPPMAQTTLYRALEDRRVFLPTRNGDRQTIDLPKFTFIGATTDEWTLSKPLRDRFKLILRLEHYSLPDMWKLVVQRCTRLGWYIEADAITGIAERARGIPRLAMRLLDATWRTVRAAGGNSITAEHLRRTCEIEQIDEMGLDPLERTYLKILQESPGAVRLNVIATQVGLPRMTIERVVESELIRIGLVTKDDAGRMLTAKGREYLSRSEVSGS